MNNPGDFIPFLGISNQQIQELNNVVDLTAEKQYIKTNSREISDTIKELTKSIRKKINQKEILKKTAKSIEEKPLSKIEEKIEEENLPVGDAQKEIDDAISGIIEESFTDHDIFDERKSFYDKEKALYSLIEGPKGVDYSKFHYGKIAEPLNTKWEYNNYKKDEEEETKFASEETLSIKEVDKIIEQKMLAGWQRKGFIDLSLDAETNDQFKYYKLFNHALTKVKYAMGFG